MLHPRLIAGTRLTVVDEAEKLIVPIVNTVLEGGDLGSIPGMFTTDSKNKQQQEQQLQIVSVPFILVDNPCTNPASAAFFKISRVSSLVISLPNPFSTQYLPKVSKCRHLSKSCLHSS